MENKNIAIEKEENFKFVLCDFGLLVVYSKLINEFVIMAQNLGFIFFYM